MNAGKGADTLSPLRLTTPSQKGALGCVRGPQGTSTAAADAKSISGGGGGKQAWASLKSSLLSTAAVIADEQGEVLTATQ